LGIVVINPMDRNHWELIEILKTDALLVIAARVRIAELDSYTDTYLNVLKRVFDDDLVINDPDYQKLTGINTKYADHVASVRKAAESNEDKPAQPINENAEITTEVAKPIKNTIKYKVQVTNELFHNGNVEAWKNIIESYQRKYPASKVTVYYDGEEVHNIHSLFKWGKVKIGNIIYFSVRGEEVKDVAKLKQLLYQGASPLFNYFIKKNPGTILKLF